MPINPSPAPYLSPTALEAEAYALLQRYHRDIKPLAGFPIPVESIVDLLLGLTLDYAPISDTEAEPILAYLEPQTRVIRLNSARQAFFDQYFGSQAFTLAHEAGHFQLHLLPENLEPLPLAAPHAENVFICHSENSANTIYAKREWQANYFASCLLMPLDMLRTTVAGLNLLEWKTLYALRDQLGVSISALIRRLKDLGWLYVDEHGKLHPNEAAAHGQLSFF